MKRRTSLAAIAEAFLPVEGQNVPVPTVSPFANKVLPKIQGTPPGLEPYASPPTVPLVAHLLRRTMFGAARADVDTLMQKGTISAAVDQLLAVSPDEASQPLAYDAREFVPIGASWVYQAESSPTFSPAGIRTNSLKAWWVGLMLNQPISVREKMVLFWHNHFVTSISTVGDPRLSYRYTALIRKNSLGNFKELTRQISFDGAMLRYLNGNSNVKASTPGGPASNENYARELQELFTIGKGPEVSAGDYTNYTETDVRAAARVLTGWKDDKTQLTVVGSNPWLFDPTRHDTGDKQFSQRYNNTLIKGRVGADGANELNDLLNMIVAQPETAKYICRKLYRWFVYYTIDDWTETNIIAPLANTLITNNFEVLPVLNVLLRSGHFSDTATTTTKVGCMIKNPLEFIIGLVRQFSIILPSTDTVKFYSTLNYLWGQASSQQLNIGDPPNVAGWPAYYQTPQFYEIWINSDTLPKRTRFTDLISKYGYTPSGGLLIAIDPIAFVKTLSNPRDPNAIVEEASQYLFAIPLTATQKGLLKTAFLQGVPDAAWIDEWDAYLLNPGNASNLNLMKSKLQALLSFMMEMPEYQLF